MKTREAREPIPEDQIQEEIVHRFAGCDLCDFEVEDFGDNEVEDIIEKHVAEKHCVAEQKSWGNVEWLRFESQELFNAYMKGRNAGSTSREERWDGRWTDVGWYREKFYRERASCRCGGCYNEGYSLDHVSTIVDYHLEEAEKHEQQAVSLAKEFGLPNPLEKT